MEVRRFAPDYGKAPNPTLLPVVKDAEKLLIEPGVDVLLLCDITSRFK